VVPKLPCDAEPVTLRCLIVDDNGDFGDAATDLLGGEGILVVGLATSASDARRKSNLLRPQLALVDIKLGEESGFDVARQLAMPAEGPKVILISTEDGQDLESLIDASPAVGFLTKTDLSAAAIHRLLAES
jgi:CheY-like chemotaxis protein